MEKITINLLPPEVNLAQKQGQKFYKIRVLSIAVMVILTFLSSTVFALRILQSQNLTLAREKFEQAQGKVSELKDQEAKLQVLKSRVTNIRQIKSNPSKQSQLFNLISAIIPPSIIVNSFGADRAGNVNLSAITADYLSLDLFLRDLVDPQINEGKIGAVDIENLSRGRDGVYRTNLKIK